MTISEKVAYLKGLAEGLDLQKEKSKESKLLTAIIDILEEIGYSIEDLEEANELLGEGLDVVSEDLEDVESILLSDDEDDIDDLDFDDDEDDCECDCDCGCGEDGFFSMECPSCENELLIDETVLQEGKIVCPNCSEAFQIDFVDEDEAEDEAEVE